MKDFPHILECRDLHRVNTSEVCQFVNETDDCYPTDGFFNYTYFTYCTLGSGLLPLVIVLLFGWLSFLFVSLAVAADDFFCPALVVIAKTLRLSDNVAGVTLLAFGNGAPDVFSAIAAVRSKKNGTINLAFGALLGSGVFITTVVAGSVCVARPFKMMERPFLRDVIFYIASVFLTYCILHDGEIRTMEAAGYIIMYGVYVLVVVVARLVYQKIKANRPQIPDRRLPGVAGSLSVSSLDDDLSRDTLDQPVYAAYHHTHHPYHAHSPNYMGSDGGQIQGTDCGAYREVDDPLLDEDDDEEMLDVSSVLPASPVIHFVHAISPVDVQQWKESGRFFRVIAVIKGVSKFLMRLTIPVVDYEEPRHNWNKHLNTIHCILSPLVAVFLAKSDLFLHYIHGVFPVWGVVLLSGFSLSLVVFLTTKPSHPPCYHWVFAYIGFTVAVIWIQCIATEVVNLLQTFGIIFDLNYVILGLTFLAWGNSIGDLIADVTMARQGYPRTGISACYGGPMFNLLLGVGIPFTIICAQNGGIITVNLGIVEILLIATLLTILPLTLITVPFILKFNMTRAFGGVLFTLYGVFVLLVVLVQCHVISWNV